MSTNNEKIVYTLDRKFFIDRRGNGTQACGEGSSAVCVGNSGLPCVFCHRIIYGLIDQWHLKSFHAILTKLGYWLDS